MHGKPPERSDAENVASPNMRLKERTKVPSVSWPSPVRRYRGSYQRRDCCPSARRLRGNYHGRHRKNCGLGAHHSTGEGQASVIWLHMPWLASWGKIQRGTREVCAQATNSIATEHNVRYPAIL